ncbi:right-handed parallel beta-helix repeat-containing protein [Arthrobacter monumenti]
MDNPLATIQAGVLIAKPGDVIVVRGGVYDEKVGWGARPGTPEAPIYLQAYPGERVQLNGYLSLRDADYWTVQGIRFGFSETNTTGESIVYFFGGTGWSFINNEVAGTRGVSNVLIRESVATSNSDADRVAAAPHDYLVGGNCIKNASRTGTHGEMHNIYLMPSIYSSGGVIERNIVAGSPLGANIKASGSRDPVGSPRHVSIRKNTLLYASTGISIGQLAERINTQGNLIAKSSNSGEYDGGVKTYDLVAPDRNAVKDSLISSYSPPIREEWGATHELFKARNITPRDVALTGSVENCTVKADSSSIRSSYGHLSR